MNFIPSSNGDTIIFGFSSNNEINFSESLTATFVYEGAALFASVFGDVPDDWQEGNPDITQLTIGTSDTTIGQNAFNSCVQLGGSLIIPNRVTSIGSYAFYSCTGFTGTLTLGNSITSIGSGAFRYCTGLTGSLNLPNSVTSIGAYAFGNLNALTGPLIIPNSASAIGNNIIENCTALTDAYLNQPLASIHTDAFISSGLTTIHLRPSPNTPAGWTIGSGQTIGNQSGVTVVANWTTYPNPP